MNWIAETFSLRSTRKFHLLTNSLYRSHSEAGSCSVITENEVLLTQGCTKLWRLLFVGPQRRSCVMSPCLVLRILRWFLDVWKISVLLHYYIYSILLLVSIPTHLISKRLILILSFQIHLYLQNGFFPSGLSTGIFVRFTSLTYMLSIMVLFICVTPCWCSLKTPYATKLLIMQLSLSSCCFLFLPNIVASTLLSDTFTFHRKCSLHGDYQQFVNSGSRRSLPGGRVYSGNLLVTLSLCGCRGLIGC
jgi:hypothetical protein